MNQIGSRQYVVLRILNENKAPIRACNLWRLGNKEVLFRKQSGERFWKEDMATMMRGIVERGLVQKIPYPNHVVFYALTQNGYEALLEKEQPKKLLKLHKEVLRRLLTRVTRRNSEEEFKVSHQQIIDTAKLLPQHQLSELIVSVFGKAKGRLEYYRSTSSTPTDTYYQTELLQFANIFNEMLKLVDEKAKTETAMLALADEEFTEQHRRDVVRGATIVRKSLGNCMFCGAEIHNEDAKKDEELLKKFVGTKTGMVCCGCFNNLQWVEKYLSVPKEVI